MFLGLVGFDSSAEAAVRRLLAAISQARGKVGASEDQRPIWQIADVLEADAFLVRGAGVVQVSGTQLQFLPALYRSASGTPCGVDLGHLKSPFAISDAAHLKSLGLSTDGLSVFNLDHETSLLRALQMFEQLLRTERSLYALAAELTERRDEFDANHTYHLEREGVMDAIVDFPRRRVLLRPGIRPADVSADAWLRRPGSANFAPAHFVECSLIELGWLFAMRCPEVTLPERYQSKPIHIKANPKVRGSLLYPRHSLLIDLLWESPHTMARLSKECPELKPWLTRDIYALYLTRCISTQKPVSSKEPASSLPPPLDNASPSLLNRLGRNMHTISADLT
ncbi:MAG: hypothetical protein EAZ37_05770 [Burkholderiales bacterium]|nr:MAG: hypothetical protein EAZ37_05770 [Burkholderiales bacterium]